MYIAAPTIAATALILIAGSVIRIAAQTSVSMPSTQIIRKARFLFGYQGFFQRPGQGNDQVQRNPRSKYPAGGKKIPWIFIEVGGTDIQKFNLTCSRPWSNIHKNASLTPISFFLANPKAKLFEQNRSGVVDTHFRWIQGNSIDGILVQRFYG